MTHQVETLALMGGVFALLVFVHFFVDWFFQSHDEAMKKSSDMLVRAQNCAVYAFGFIPVLFFLQLSQIEALCCLTLLFFSHFIEDTYYPVFLWAKYIRRPPEFDHIEFNQEKTDGRQLSDLEAFIRWASTPLGKIITIVIDQTIHIAFLLPIAYLAVK